MFNFLKRKKRIPEEIQKAPGTFSVVIVNQEGNLTDDLGITEERAVLLSQMVQTNYITSKRITEVAEKVSAHCVHANEVFYISLIIADIHHKHNMMSKMGEMMRSMGKGDGHQ